ncbi:MAG: histidine phosphatase family protein [Anaerolineales bacterium]|jgi:phosphohistidine phosphatase
MMKTLLLMRHAKSSWSDSSLSDHERPLNNRGINAAGKMGKLISDLDLIPEIILSSSSKRTKETIRYFLDSCPFSGEVIYTRNLYHGGPEEFLESLRQWGEGFLRVMIVGHNPGMEYALEEFTGERERMVTASIAQIEFESESWHSLLDDPSGDLVNFWRPREVG